MSDNAIRVGDLVCVVHACCAIRKAQGLGWVFKVVALGCSSGVCAACGTPFANQAKAEFKNSKGAECSPLSWLRRIPPLGELDEAERKIEEPIA